MKRANALLSLLALLSTGVAVASTPVAYVYVQEDSTQTGNTAPSPISVYAVASNGTLTQVKGSPLKQIAGVLVGNNGSHIITLDASYLHSYPVSSGGVIGAQDSEINASLYAGGSCAGVPSFQWAQPNFAVMDHTGEFVYIISNGSNLYGSAVPACSSLQTFKVSKTGVLTFLDNPFSSSDQDILHLTATGNNKFALLTGQSTANGGLVYTTLVRASNGDLSPAPNVAPFDGTPNPAQPTPKPSSDSYYAWPQFGESPDPTDHLAVLVEEVAGCESISEAIAGTNEAGCVSESTYLASYTMNSKGQLSSTNTWENLPLAPAETCCADNLMLNPAGAILAVAAGTDVQFFKFDGASPIKALTKSTIVGDSGTLSPMAWDNANHFYALNNQSGKLHIWTVTDKGTVEAPGSPYSNVPFCGYSTQADAPKCTQTLIVRSN